MAAARPREATVQWRDSVAALPTVAPGGSQAGRHVGVEVLERVREGSAGARDGGGLPVAGQRVRREQPRGAPGEAFWRNTEKRER